MSKAAKSKSRTKWKIQKVYIESYKDNGGGKYTLTLLRVWFGFIKQRREVPADFSKAHRADHTNERDYLKARAKDIRGTKARWDKLIKNQTIIND